MPRICKLKRFFIRYSIAHGVQIIGYANIPELLFLIGVVCVLEDFILLTISIFPILCFYFFIRMMKLDSIKARRNYFLMYTIMFIATYSMYAE